MAQIFVGLVNGVKKWIAAITISAGAGDAGKIPALDAAGKLDNSFMPTGTGEETEVVVASEAISAGNFVNKWNDGGTLKVRKADASGGRGKKADGFVIASVSLDGNAIVYPLSGYINNQLSGLTIGAEYWLSATTAGEVSAVPPSETSGNVIQLLGKASSATAILTENKDAIEIE